MKHMRMEGQADMAPQEGATPAMPDYQMVESVPGEMAPVAPEPPERKRHRIFDHKYFATFWSIFLFFVLGNLVSLVVVIAAMYAGLDIDQDLLGRINGSITGLALLLWFHFHFRKEFRGIMQWSGQGMKLVLPALSFVAVNLLGFLETTDVNPIIPVVVMALSPGIAEEVIFRGMPCSNWMRVRSEERDIMPCVLFTSVVFGVVHGANILSGAALSSTIFQISYAFALGVFFAAVFLRCGSIWPTIVMHTLIDATGFLFMDMADNGIITEELVIDWEFYVTAVAAVSLLVIGLYLVRPSKRAQIAQLWKDKWDKAQ